MKQPGSARFIDATTCSNIVSAASGAYLKKDRMDSPPAPARG